MKSSQCGKHLAVLITHTLSIHTVAHSYHIARVPTTLRMSSVQKEKVAIFYRAGDGDPLQIVNVMLKGEDR